MKSRFLTLALVLMTATLPIPVNANWSETQEGVTLVSETRHTLNQATLATPRIEETPVSGGVLKNSPTTFVKNVVLSDSCTAARDLITVNMTGFSTELSTTAWQEFGGSSATGGGISANGGASEAPVVVAANDGTIYVAWKDGSSGNDEIYVKRWDGSNWSEVGADSARGGGISNTSGESRTPSIALSPSGAPYVAWSDRSNGQFEVYVRRWNGSVWEEAGTGAATGGGVSNSGAQSYLTRGSLAIAPNGTPYIAWDEDDGSPDILVKKLVGASWVEASPGSAAGGGISNTSAYSYYPNIAFASDGTPYIAWQDDGWANYDFDIYARRMVGSAWQEIGAGSASGTGISPPADWSVYPGIVLSPENVPYVAWTDRASGIHQIYMKRWNGTSWIEAGPGAASGGGVSGTPGASTSVALAMHPNGRPYVAWSDTAAGANEIYVRGFDGYSWIEVGVGSASGGGISSNSGTSTSPNLVVAPNGAIYAAWADNSSGNYEIYVRRWLGAVAPVGPPAILVHGWMGLSTNPPEVWRSCSAGLQVFDPANPRHAVWAEVASALSDAGYAVYVANLTSSPVFTPRIEVNADCLKRQIGSVASSDNPAVLVAHSMGGLVSRAYMENHASYEDDVSHLITLGTPHGGVNWILLRWLLILPPVDAMCLLQPAFCQFSANGAPLVNARYHDRANNSDYTLVGGTSDTALARIVSVLDGPNDSFVGRNSANGFYWPFGTAVDNDNGRVGRYQTVAHHEGYFTDTNTLDCIEYRLGLGGNCDQLAAEGEIETRTEPPLTGHTVDLVGVLSSGQTVNRSIAVDTTAASVFMLTWMDGALSFTLTNPSGLAITPAYAASHPAEVSYSSGDATIETPPWASYAFTNTVPGLWTLSIGATSAPSGGTSYMASVYMETDLLLAAGADQSLYEIGETATFTATLNSTSGGIAGAAVEAIIARSDGVTETIQLADQGSGNYQGSYIAPNAPGSLFASVVATGTHGGFSFSRQVDLALGVASPYVSLSGQYNARTPDDNGDGQFDSLLIDVDIAATRATTITLSGALVSAEVTRTLTAITTAVISAGTHVVTLDFPGRSIHKLRGDGPYTLANVTLEDLSVGGVLADTANNAFVTAPYDHRQFGLRGDVDDSCAVDIEDVISIADAWNLSDFDPVLDINRDGVITIADIMLAAGNWGASCWQ